VLEESVLQDTDADNLPVLFQDVAAASINGTLGKFFAAVAGELGIAQTDCDNIGRNGFTDRTHWMWQGLTCSLRTIFIG
jgi:hypothetical protein